MKAILIDRLLRVSEKLDSLSNYQRMVEDTRGVQEKLESGYSSLMESMNKRDVMEATRLLRALKKLSEDLGGIVSRNDRLVKST